MTEHPHNIRATRPAERTHNSPRRHRSDTTNSKRAYFGGHRANHPHDDTRSASRQRSSRPGRHHAR